jgi:hypothetical protein
MSWQWILAAWTGIGLLWWLMASLLVASASQRREEPGPLDRRRITVFKALAGPLGEQEFFRLSHSLETFVAELDENSELLIGVHHADQPHWQAFVQRMGGRFPAADIKLVGHRDPGRHAANPKVSWMQILARHATGELWFWSDADIEAPAGALRSLRADFARGKARMVTSPYVIQRGGNAPGLLDALFVNLEFYPGVVLLGRLDRIQFGFGSGMLFEAREFRCGVDWAFLGECLADDFHLGRLLQPVRLGSMRLTTVPASENWLGAIAHYHRWQKTIRWSTPGSFAAQLMVLPALGWLAWLTFHPTQPSGWLGLTTVLAIDAVAALWICALLECRIGWRRLHAIPLWTLIRALTWAACWLPSPIVWRGRRWWSPRQAATGDVSAVETRQQSGAE